MPKARPSAFTFSARPRRPSGSFFPVFGPVAQRPEVVVPYAEPPVVHDEELDARAFARLRETEEFCFIDREICGFPAVEEDRPYGVPPFCRHDVVPDESVHAPAHFPKAPIRKDHDRFRGLEAFPFGEAELEMLRIDPRKEPCLVKTVHRCFFEMIAAVYKVEAEAFSRVFRRIRTGQHDEGIRAARRRSGR